MDHVTVYVTEMCICKPLQHRPSPKCHLAVEINTLMFYSDAFNLMLVFVLDHRLNMKCVL